MGQKKVLIVGAGGFIGGFIAAESLRRGYETWCGVRESTSRRYLTDSSLHFITLDYDNPDRLAEQLKGHHWDYIVYNLGATKCVNFMDFNRINYNYLRDFVDTLREIDAVPSRMVYMSSLSALGPGDEKGYTPLDGDSIPAPNTRYGLSKIKAETYLQSLPKEFPWIILRPTGVYGPHEQDYLMMIKTIDAHFDFGVGMRRQMLTFIYVEDLARAIFDALERAPLTVGLGIPAEPLFRSRQSIANTSSPSPAPIPRKNSAPSSPRPSGANSLSPCVSPCGHFP